MNENQIIVQLLNQKVAMFLTEPSMFTELLQYPAYFEKFFIGGRYGQPIPFEYDLIIDNSDRRIIKRKRIDLIIHLNGILRKLSQIEAGL